MKKCVKNIICLFALLGAGLTVSAQNITIFFYAPTATMTTNFTGATAAYLNAEGVRAAAMLLVIHMWCWITKRLPYFEQ